MGEVGKRVRSQDQRERDRGFIAELRLKGYPFVDIMERLNASRSYSLTLAQIRSDYEFVRRGWRKSAQQSVAELMNIELAWCAVAEREAWEGFELSKRSRLTETHQTESPKPADTETVAAMTKGMSKEEKALYDKMQKSGKRAYTLPKVREIQKTEYMIGNPVWLARAIQVREYRAKLLGLLDPETHNTIEATFVISDQRPLITDAENDAMMRLLSNVTGAPLPIPPTVAATDVP